MEQAWRDWYLGALGVVRYLPRDMVVAESAAVDVPSRDTQREPLVAEVAPVREQRHPALPEIKPAAKIIDKPARQQRPEVTPTDAESELVQFRLAFWQPSSQLVVLSSMPPGIRPGQSQIDMLANLLKAIRQLNAPLPQVELLDWPLSPGADSSLRGARELLTAYLDIKQQLKPFQWVLLMGQMAARLTVSSTTNPAVGDKPDLSCKAQGIVTHSLYEMDQDKALKKGTWEALRFLAGEAS